ncbi:MAG: outer membrane protein [Pseudomonadota bacterium]
MTLRLKSCLFAAAIAVGGICSANAADLAARTYTKAPVPVLEPVYNWTGFYIGADAGYGWGRDRHTDLTPGGNFWTTGGAQSIKPTGAVYGGQIGYNWQLSNWVVGLEAQFNGASLKRTDASVFFPATDSLRAKVDFYTTVTGRVGYALNNWLPYIKGGYAGAQLKTINFDGLGDSLNHSDWQNGFVVGAGLEYAFAGNWIVGVEYNYMDFGKQTFTASNTPATLGIESFKDHLTISTVTGRISYKFGGPVVARY